jgi:hypothetical protein
LFKYSFTRILENVLHNFVNVAKLRLLHSVETKNAYKILMGGSLIDKDLFENLSTILYVNRVRDRWNWLKIVFRDEVQWRTEGGVGVFNPPPNFRSFDKAEPNSQFRGKYIRNCLVFLFHHPN